MRTESLFPLGLALGLAVNGCTMPPAGSLSPEESNVTLEVENTGWRTLNVYTVTDGVQMLLGRVGASESRAFSIPATRVVGTVQLLAAPIGSRSGHLSEPIVFTPGQQALWKLVDTPGSSIPRFSTLSFTAIPLRTNLARRAGSTPY